ncbi:MAG: hypothetical protein SLAVMIC_00681 [uncultured marine phage]|uniref:Uncharacterized protein n=1 Tax=uncultured marine phage TaxID=707152 RepID=A0A8D9CFJ9_9VIRU|nr:MAG: hypothetical protein SLAVMIC_00681 [uncultured marine phage]
MKKFKVGEQVRVITDQYVGLTGLDGIVTEVYTTHNNYYEVTFKLADLGGYNGSQLFYEDEIENIQRRREERLKKLLDKN